MTLEQRFLQTSGRQFEYAVGSGNPGCLHDRAYRPKPRICRVLERTLEVALSRYPQLLHENWTLVGQQLATGVGILDQLFKDRDGNLQLVEVKKGPATIGALTQVLRYAEKYRAEGRRAVPWVVAHSIPRAVELRAAELGVVTRAIGVAELETFLASVGQGVAEIMSLRRRPEDVLGGGAGDLWRSVEAETAYSEMSVDTADVLRALATQPQFVLKTGAMQTTIWYRGVKLGGFNRKHRGGQGYVTSGIITPALRPKLEALGFRWMDKKQAGKSHVHTWMEISSERPLAFRAGLDLARAVVDLKLG